MAPPDYQALEPSHSPEAIDFGTPDPVPECLNPAGISGRGKTPELRQLIDARVQSAAQGENPITDIFELETADSGALPAGSN